MFAVKVIKFFLVPLICLSPKAPSRSNDLVQFGLD